MTGALLASIQTGAIAPLGPDDVPSGFVKRPIEGPVAVGPLGLAGDAQADRRVHGGPDKAVYGYSAETYARWRAEHPEHGARLAPGGFGENLTITGLAEADLCVGDVHAIGGVRLQVCQPRQPCFKLALHFDDNRMPKAMVRSGRSGWYYRVIETGRIAPGDAIARVDRPHPHLVFERLIAIVYHGDATRQELEWLAAAAGVADAIRAKARAALDGG